MKLNGTGTFINSFVVLAAISFVAGTAAVGKNKDKTKGAGHNFEDVYYLFGPTARQSHDRVSGESAKGALRFDRASRVVFFVAYLEPGMDSTKDGSSGPGFQVPYDKIRKLEEENESKARMGSWAIGAGAGALFIRKHRHFLVIHYTDEKNNNRSALLQLDKGDYKDLLKAAEQETGLKIEK